MTCWRRLRDCQQAGVWEKLHETLLSRLHGAEGLDVSGHFCLWALGAVWYRLLCMSWVALGILYPCGSGARGGNQSMARTKGG